MIRRIALATGIACSLALPAAALAQQVFPSKIVRVINPNQPGGNSDIIFRLLSPKMGEALGQQVVIDYRPGAGGNIGTEMTAKAAPDGYTTLIAAAAFVINPSILKTLPFDPIKDFTPLGLIVDTPAALVVHPSLPAKSVKELIALSRSGRGQIFFSSSGNGGLGHLSGELLNALAKTRFIHVPYKGAGPAAVDLVAGHVQLSFLSVPAVLPHVQGNRLRMLAQCGEKRFSAIPDVPTMQEAGVPGFVVSSGFSFLGPAGLPRPIVERLNGALVQSLRDGNIRKQLIERGADPIGSTPEQHATYIKAEIEKWQRVAAQAGIKPE